MDFATKLPEVILLRGIEAKIAAEALLTVRLGFPKEMVTDLDSIFMSQVMRELLQVYRIKHLTAMYHLQANDHNKRFKGTLNYMLKTYAAMQSSTWDQRLQHLLFSYRQVLQESSVFSTLEVRVPLDILKDHPKYRCSHLLTRVLGQPKGSESDSMQRAQQRPCMTP